MSKAYMPFYVGDFLADTMHLGATERGIYISLIIHCWQHDGAIPRDDRQLARISHCEARQWWRYKDSVLAFFDIVNDVSMQHGKVLRLLHSYNEKASVFKERAVLAARAKHASSSQSESTSYQKRGKMVFEKEKEVGGGYKTLTELGRHPSQRKYSNGR